MRIYIPYCIFLKHFIWERLRTSGRRRWRENLKRTPAEHGAPLEAQSHNPKFTTRAKTKIWTHNQLCNPGALTRFLFSNQHCSLGLARTNRKLKKKKRKDGRKIISTNRWHDLVYRKPYKTDCNIVRIQQDHMMQINMQKSIIFLYSAIIIWIKIIPSCLGGSVG